MLIEDIGRAVDIEDAALLAFVEAEEAEVAIEEAGVMDATVLELSTTNCGV